jgi:hypothetical protein
MSMKTVKKVKAWERPPVSVSRDLDRLRMRVARLRYTPEERRRMLAMLDTARPAATPPPPRESDNLPLLIPPDPREGRAPRRARR